MIADFCQDNWQPALEKLVASIGEKFSAAFDRKHQPLLTVEDVDVASLLSIFSRYQLCGRDSYQPT